MSTTAENTQPHIGMQLSDTTFTIDQAMLESYYAGLALEAPAAPVVPSTLVSRPDNDYIAESAYSNRHGHLWVRQQWEFLAPLKIDQTYSVSASVVDIYPRRDRNIVQYSTEFHGDAGEPKVRSQHHQSFLRDQSASGEVELRSPSAKPGARKFEIPPGEQFGELERTISVQMCGEFFYGKSNYHTNQEASRELGFNNIVVGGRMTMAYAAHILEQQFGDAWYSSGRMDIKFTNPVWVDDTVIARGVLTNAVDEEPNRRSAFVWLETTDGTIVLVGTASVLCD